MDLDAFAAAVHDRTAQWQQAGAEWELHRGPTRDKSAAWVHYALGDRLAQLTVWTSGEAELDIGWISTGATTVTSLTVHTPADLSTCLDHLANL